MNPLKHVAIIMDGNGRWGLKRKKSRNFGHKEGLKNLKEIIKASISKKIKFLTLFAFSTENWKRPKKEIKLLFSLLNNYIDNEIQELINQNVKIVIIGNLKKFPSTLKKKLTNIEKQTKNNRVLQINLALNYGAREEILRSIKLLSKRKLKINVKNFEKNLYSHNTPDPDILIRTGNTKRISNFLVWQIIYTEIFFEKKLWPDFKKKDYYKILNQYKKIKRNFGGINA